MKDGNFVPSFLVCPTPAAYLSDAGAPLLAVASSLDASLLVLDAAGGGQLARHTVAGPALASPVVANGMLIATAFNGITEALSSGVNHAPAAPSQPRAPVPSTPRSHGPAWLPATDADAEQPSYELRSTATVRFCRAGTSRSSGPGVTSTAFELGADARGDL